MDNFNITNMESVLSSFIPEYSDKAGLFLCMKGNAEMLINNQLYHISRGTIYIISPLVTIYKVSEDEEFEGIHILDDMDVIYTVIHTIIDTILHLKLRNNPCLMLKEDDISFIVSQKRRIDEKMNVMQSGMTDEAKRIYRHMIHLIEQETMLEVITIYFRNSMVESEPIDKNEAIIYSFIFSLHANCKTQRSVAFYANEANLSPGYFSTIVRQQTGKTPSEWITAMTIVNAKLLLEKSKKTIKEISSELNFPEQYTFGKYFKQYTGLSPKAYRLMKKSAKEG
ncbi:MAG: helix-turn-helix transcriptional regulator [Prevotellaceae bacterium]|nr:helix-turn-helix transcriptional regulator [Prevotellaceae bacterium]